jgi:hypothetical protein
MLGILAILSLIGIPISAAMLLESWNTMTGSRSPLHPVRRGGKPGRTVLLVRRFFGTSVSSVYDIEVRTLLRKREGIGNAITLAGLLAFAVYFYGEFHTFMGFPHFLREIIPILVVGLALYLTVVSLSLVPALAVLLMLPFVIMLVAVPIPLVTGLNPVAILFTSMGATVMFLSATGIGLWHGARSPNFDESSGNAPDVMTMYTFMLLILFLSVFLLAPPLVLAFNDKILGFLALVLALDVSVLILYLGIKGAANGLSRLEISM